MWLRTRRRRAVLLLAGATAAVAAVLPVQAAARVARHSPPGWPALASARPFFLDELEDKVTGDWAAAWQTLYPPHQRVAPRIDFVSCERATPFPAQLQGLRVLGVRRSLVRVPGRAQPVAGVAVDVRVALRWYGPRDPIVFRYTFHLVPAAGRWTWLLSEARYRLYRDGGCTPALVA
jgi:hypothetical protein